MTKEECAIVTIYTGVVMLEGDDLEYLYRYAEKLMERPMFTHELATLADKLKKRAKPDFINLCRWASAQPNTSNTLNALDCISRQAAIDEISEYGSGNSVYMSVGELKRRIEQLPPAQPEQANCEYCHEDSDGYVSPIEKNSHAWLVRRGRTMKLRIGFKGEYRECDIYFCPMCGRRLNHS